MNKKRLVKSEGPGVVDKDLVELVEDYIRNILEDNLCNVMNDKQFKFVALTDAFLD